MFDGVPEQFHQFMISSSSRGIPATAANSSSPPPPLSLPLPPLSAFPSTFHHGFIDPFPNPNPNPIPPSQHHFLQHHHHPSILLHHKDGVHDDEEAKDRSLLAMSMNFDIDAPVDRPIPDDARRPWSDDEVVALLRIGSSIENWFPEVTWEHVSRKLGELGFKRSAEMCKEKFEEHTRSFNNNNNNINNVNVGYSSKSNNYRLLVNELDELYAHHPQQIHPTPPPPPPHQEQLHELPSTNDNDGEKRIGEEEGDNEEDKEEEEEEEEAGEKMSMEEVGSRAVEENPIPEEGKRLVEEKEEDRVSKKRKRQEKFEMFKRFCEDVVGRLMAKQEEMHNKLLEDMVRRDKETAEKEEAWKKVEMERVEKELDARANEHAIARDRQASIIGFLKKFAASSNSLEGREGDNLDCSSPNPNLADGDGVENASEILPSATKGSTDDDRPDPSPPPPATVPPNPNPKSPTRNPRISNPEGSNTGNRWPKEEVLALINLRCTIQGNGEDKDQSQNPSSSTGTSGVKAPLWERISKGMSELGYKRSAKRCKEKWENINKYFRKTKDINANKKRSLDSRTCPYFHQLSTLYNQGKLSAAPEHRPPSSPEIRPTSEDTQ